MEQECHQDMFEDMNGVEQKENTENRTTIIWMEISSIFFHQKSAEQMKRKNWGEEKEKLIVKIVWLFQSHSLLNMWEWQMFGCARDEHQFSRSSGPEWCLSRSMREGWNRGADKRNLNSMNEFFCFIILWRKSARQWRKKSEEKIMLQFPNYYNVQIRVEICLCRVCYCGRSTVPRVESSGCFKRQDKTSGRHRIEEKKKWKYLVDNKFILLLF